MLQVSFYIPFASNLDGFDQGTNFYLLLDCSVWKFERTDAADLKDYGVPLSKLQDEQEFVVEGATLRLCLVFDISWDYFRL